MQEGRRSSPLGPQRSRTKVPRRGTFSSKQLVFSWLKFLCEALGRSSLRTKLRASSMHLHGLTNKIGSSTRSVSSMHREGRGDFSESVNSYMLKYAHANCAILLSNPYNKIPGPILASQQPRSARDQPMVQAECRERACSSYAEATPIDAERKREPEWQPRRARGDDEASVARSAARGAYRHHHSTQHCAAQQYCAI